MIPLLFCRSHKRSVMRHSSTQKWQMTAQHFDEEAVRELNFSQNANFNLLKNKVLIFQKMPNLPFSDSLLGSVQERSILSATQSGTQAQPDIRIEPTTLNL